MISTVSKHSSLPWAACRWSLFKLSEGIYIGDYSFSHCLRVPSKPGISFKSESQSPWASQVVNGILSGNPDGVLVLLKFFDTLGRKTRCIWKISSLNIYLMISWLGSSGIWHWHIGTLTIPTEVGGTMPIYGCRSGLSSFPGWPFISQPSVDAATVRYYSASHPAAGEHDNDPWPAKTAPKNACRNTDGLQRQVSQVLFLRCCGAGLATN